MPNRWQEDDLVPELRTEEGKRLLAALLDWQVGRVQVIERFHRKHHPAMGYLDATINLHIFVMRHYGTRQQQIVDSIGAPRRTIRTVLERLQSGGLIMRDSRGLYFPTRTSAASANAIFPITLRAMRRICDAYRDYDETVRPRK